jgi:hypothetical protein
VRLERRGVLLVLAVVAGVAAVAAASRSWRPDAEGRAVALSPGTSDTAWQVAAGLFAVLGIVVLAAVVWGAAGGRRGPVPHREKRSRIGMVVGAILFVVVVSQLDRGEPPSVEAPPGVGDAGGGEPGAGDRTEEEAPSPAGSLVVAGAVVLLLAATTAAVARGRSAGGAGEQAAAGDERAPGSAAAATGADLVEAAERARDPREAVLLAFAAAERRLAATPLARPPATSPREWLVTVRGSAPDLGEPLGVLVGRYEIARFSHHPVGEADRRRALRALADLP